MELWPLHFPKSAREYPVLNNIRGLLQFSFGNLCMPRGRIHARIRPSRAGRLQHRRGTSIPSTPRKRLGGKRQNGCRELAPQKDTSRICPTFLEIPATSLAIAQSRQTESSSNK